MIIRGLNKLIEYLALLSIITIAGAGAVYYFKPELLQMPVLQTLFQQEPPPPEPPKKRRLLGNILVDKISEGYNAVSNKAAAWVQTKQAEMFEAYIQEHRARIFVFIAMLILACYGALRLLQDVIRFLHQLWCRKK